MSALDMGVDIVCGSQVPGDYLEFGVYHGGSFVRVYGEFAKKRKLYGVETPMRFFAFDAFKGLPGSDESNKPAHYAEGKYAAGEATFREAISAAKVDLGDVVIVNKWYDQLTGQDKRDHHLIQAALVYIDCDLYESTKSALDFCGDLLLDGSVVVFDDFYRHRSSKRTGVRGAWLEFLEARADLEATMVHSFRRVAFVIHKLEQPSSSSRARMGSRAGRC